MPSLASKLPAGNDLISMATQHNPSYLSALDNIRASRSEVHVRRGAFSPTLDLRASKQLGDNLGTYEGRYDRSLVELVFNVNLSRGGADKARLEVAAQRLNSALDLRDKACVDMRQTAVIAYNDVRKLKEQLGACVSTGCRPRRPVMPIVASLTSASVRCWICWTVKTSCLMLAARSSMPKWTSNWRKPGTCRNRNPSAGAGPQTH